MQEGRRRSLRRGCRAVLAPCGQQSVSRSHNRQRCCSSLIDVDPQRPARPRFERPKLVGVRPSLGFLLDRRGALLQVLQANSAVSLIVRRPRTRRMACAYPSVPEQAAIRATRARDEQSAANIQRSGDPVHRPDLAAASPVPGVAHKRPRLDAAGDAVAIEHKDDDEGESSVNDVLIC